MGKDDKIPVTSEKKSSFKGLYDAKEMYKAIKYYLEDARHYDLSETDVSETNIGDSVEIVAFGEAELQYSDYFRVFIIYKLQMEGKSVDIKMNGKPKKLTEGSALLIINAYIEPDFMGKRKESALMDFVSKVYDKYFGKDELSKCIGTTSGDVSGLMAVFKDQVNSNLK